VEVDEVVEEVVSAVVVSTAACAVGATIAAAEPSVEVVETTTWVVSGTTAPEVGAEASEVEEVVGTGAGRAVEEAETAASPAGVEDAISTGVCDCTTTSEVEEGGVLLVSRVDVAEGVGQTVSYQTTIL
jgi:hypothetical protein